MDDSGISQKIGERIESKCLDHLAVSNVNGNGYEQLFQKYGWFDAVRNPTVQACKRAYLATIGKYGTDALQGIGKLLMNDDAVPKKDYEISGLLYKALEDTCGKKELSIEETLDSKKERSIAKYLTDVLDIMTKFHSVTSNSPAYLANPVPHVMQTDSAILSLEKQFAELAAACLPPKIEILKAETIPTEAETIAETIPTELKKDSEPVDIQSAKEVLVDLLKRLRGIREIRNVGIDRVEISLNTKQEALNILKIMLPFGKAYEELCAQLELDCSI
ncbi:MAG: hypothetical protein EXS60_01135 [Candidatus Pacebacteria bacterium]|nr:hypothetical protein [Candidatus Paceibacterota bacterium]